MSDQDSKPVEGVKTPVETPDVEMNGSTTATDVPQTDSKEDAKATVENGEVTKGDGQDATQTAPKGNDDNDNNEDESTSVAQVTGNGEVDEPMVDVKQRVWPSINRPPKGMLKVNRGGCPTRKRSDPSLLPDSDDPKAIRWQVRTMLLLNTIFNHI